MKEVMAIHDEVMPKMSQLNAMIVKLEAEVRKLLPSFLNFKMLTRV
jgi:hypothetical protein